MLSLPVIPGLVPAIHVDPRDKPGDDDVRGSRTPERKPLWLDDLSGCLTCEINNCAIAIIALYIVATRWLLSARSENVDEAANENVDERTKMAMNLGAEA
jgi:hypothetical protein